MILRKQGNIYVLESSYAEKETAKAAGFWWHAGPGKCRRAPCAECEMGLGAVWWTGTPAVALLLIEAADPEARAALAPAMQTVEESRAADADVDVPKPEGLEYLGYQRAGIAYAMQRRFTLFGDEMGLGKTIQALGVVNAIPEAQNVLVICPASLRINWYREAKKWLTRPFNFVVIDRTMECPTWASFVMVNYDKLLSEPVFASLLRREWDVVIVDEMHKCKNPKARRTHALYGKPCEDCKATGKVRKTDENGDQMRGSFERCLTCEGTGLSRPGLIARAGIGEFLTGTPIVNRPGEMFTFLHAAFPEEFPNWYAFRHRFCAGFDDGASNLEQLQARLRGLCMVRRLKADVLKDLPPKTRSIVLLAKDDFEEVLEAERRALANVADAQEALDALQAAKESETEGSVEYQVAVAKLKEIRIPFEEISRVRHATALAKVPAVRERMDEVLEAVPKLVVWAHHKDVLASLAEPYGTDAIKCDGETSMSDRQKAVDRFQTDPKCRVAVLSISAMGVGWTLTAASHEIFAELPWTPAEVTQAEDRCHRIGQHDNVTVEHLVIDDSIDAKMAKTIVRKQEISDRALDRPSTLDVKPTIVAPLPVESEREVAAKSIENGGHVSAQVSPAAAPVQTTTPDSYTNRAQFDDEHKAAALKAMQILAGVCDGARSWDGAGFSKYDADFGRKLASVEKLSDKQTYWAVRLATKYRRQLASTGLLETLGIVYEASKKRRAKEEAVA